MNNFSILNADSVVISEGDGGYCDPGSVKSLTLQYQNISGKDLTGVIRYPFPGKVNDDFENNVNAPIANADIIKQTNRGVNQVATIAKEDGGAALTAFTGRVKCLEYISGVWTVRDTGAVNFPAAPGDRVYILCNEKILNLYYNPGTAGVYTTLNIKIWTGAAWAIPAGLTNGTSNLSVEGRINLLTSDAATWEKVQIFDTTNDMVYWAYAVEISSPDASPTQAISTTTGFQWDYVYDLPKHFLLDTGLYYLKPPDANPYIPVTPDYEFPNLGRIVFQDDPFAVYTTYSLVCEITYKLPQSGSYVIDATGANAVTVTIDGGSPSAPIGVQTGINPNTGLYYQNTNIISGISIGLNALTSGDQGTIPISELLKYLYQSLDDITFINADLPLGDIDDNDSVTVYSEFRPPIDSVEGENEWIIEDYLSGD
jgi:hypothetical protein